MVNNVGRDFKRHTKIADIKFDGHFSIHTFRKSCAQNWADYLPANVVKFFLGHSTLSTTNRFYSIVDESHATLTKTTMDALLKTVTTNDLDTEQTLAPELAPKEDKKMLNTPSANPVNPSPEDTCEMGNNGRYRTPAYGLEPVAALPMGLCPSGVRSAHCHPNNSGDAIPRNPWRFESLTNRMYNPWQKFFGDTKKGMNGRYRTRTCDSLRVKQVL